MPPDIAVGPRAESPAVRQRCPGPAGSTARGWAYKTDAAGRPRRFLSHREAAWWAVRRVGAFFSPFLASSILWALLGSPYERSTVLPVVAVLASVWLAVVGTVYLYLALSGGVMDKAERRRRGDGAGAR